MPLPWPMGAQKGLEGTRAVNSVTILNLANNIIQLVDFLCNLLSERRSTSRATVGDYILKEIADHLTGLMFNITKISSVVEGPFEGPVELCQHISRELLRTIK